jgi:hypothetical protein
MKPNPIILFHGQSLIQHAHSITAKIQQQVSSASYEYLSAEPVDTLIQHLYSENQIILPYLKRDQISHDHFEYYLEPYIDPPKATRFGQRRFTNPTKGIIFAFEVGFVGEKRYFTMSPSKSEPNHPLAYVGDESLTVYIAQQNRRMPEVEQAFENTLALIDAYLKLQRETLLNYPMTFYRTIEAVIVGRLNALNRTREIAGSLKYPAKSQAPSSVVVPLKPNPVAPQAPIETPIPAITSMSTSHTFILLTGAGFSRNWGGMLAGEVFENLLSDKGLDKQTRDMLFEAQEAGGFEDVLAALETSRSSDDKKRYDALVTAVVGLFNGMGQSFMQMKFEFQNPPDTRYSVYSFLNRFHAIFTTNQDTLLEQHYIPTVGGQPWGRAHLPGLKYLGQPRLTGSLHDRIAIMEPNPSDFKLAPGIQPYISFMDLRIGLRAQAAVES